MATTFTWKPTYSTSEAVTTRVKVSSLGDGYAQRVGDGLNTQPLIYSLTFVDSSATIELINAFLEATGGVDYFNWTPSFGTSSLKFVYKSKTMTALGSGVYQLDTTFYQVFDLT